MGVWLLAMALAVVVQVVLGGITRLTDSGLSITEWKPLLGVVPPLDEEGWNEAFSKYQQIPQYRLLKSHLTLADFRLIYFWEWFHRLWGRLLGLFFVVPLALWWRGGRLDGLKGRLLLLLAFGGLQGLLGWVMVASGLADLVYVSHLRLAAHFLLAVLLLAALVWLGLELLIPEQARGGPKSLQRMTVVMLGLLFVQLAWGAFMAGLKAALMAPTWPTINGAWVPSSLWEEYAWWNNALSVHFVHRNLGYLLTGMVLLLWWKARRWVSLERHLAVGLVGLQVLLGVLATTQSYVPGRLLWLGVSHQLVAVLLWVVLFGALLRLSPARGVLRSPTGIAAEEDSFTAAGRFQATSR